MKKRTKWFLVTLAIVLIASAVNAAAPAETPALDYTIGDGDVLLISVWKDPALTRQVTVLPGGKISFPLVGELMAGGKTTAELKSELTEKISKFVPEPTLTLEVQSVNSLLIYVIGQVNHPGRFALNSQIDVLQALASAGGLNAFAKRNKIQIYRKSKNGPETLPFKYDEVIEGEGLKQNILLQRGDVIVVP
ncbi:MAG: polysaccharide biosynthesis/export family protein [Pseudomonadota bacterium]